MKTYYKLLFSLILAGITMFLQIALYAQEDMESRWRLSS